MTSTSRNIEEIYEYIVNETGKELALDDFILELGDIMRKRGEGMCRPRSPSDTLSPTPGRGLDALSEWLLKEGISSEKYNKIVNYACPDYLDHR